MAHYSRDVAPEFDNTDFVDPDYLAARQGAAGSRPPSREELEHRVGDTHQKLAELRRAQEALERERAALEESRRQRVELATGREELLQSLTRGVGLLEEAQLKTSREAQQMNRTLEGFRDALAKVESIQEDAWTQENWNAELRRGLTVLENARNEWNAGRLRWTILDGLVAPPDGSPEAKASRTSLDQLDFFQLVRIGLAFTFPLLVLGALAFGVWLIYLLRK
jgi:hypothetical protein